MDLVNLFLYIDYFGRPLKMRIDGASKFKTHFGSFITIIIVVLMISLLIQQSQNMIYHKNPNINQMTLYSQIAPDLNINKNSLMWAFQIIDSKFLPFYDETYFTFDINQFELIRNDNGSIVTKQTPLPLVNCSEKRQDFSKFDSNYDGNGLDFAKCLGNQTVDIGGDFSGTYYSNLNFFIRICMNSTKSSNCKPLEAIINRLNQGYFEFYFIDKYINTDNFTEPYQEFFKTYYVLLDPQLFKNINFYFQRSTINTDTGFLFESIEEKEVILFDKTHESTSITIKNNTIIQFDITPSNNYQKLKRNYMKIQDLAATLGGILKMFLTFGILITEIANNVRLTEKLINHLFTFEENDFLKKNRDKELIDLKKAEDKMKFLSEFQISNIIEIKSNKDSTLKISKCDNSLKDGSESNLGMKENIDLEILKKNPNFEKKKQEGLMILENLIKIPKYTLELNYFEMLICPPCRSKKAKLRVFEMGKQKVHQYFDFLRWIKIQDEVEKIKTYLFDENFRMIFSLYEKPLLSAKTQNNNTNLQEIFESYILLLSKNTPQSKRLIDSLDIEIKSFFDKMIEKMKNDRLSIN